VVSSAPATPGLRPQGISTTWRDSGKLLGDDLDIRHEANADPVANEDGESLLLNSPDQKQAEYVAGLINVYTHRLHLD
jgi:hypothetical protein